MRSTMFRFASSIASMLAAVVLASVATAQPVSGPFVGTYSLARPGADAVQELTLRLRSDRIASLRIETPGYTQTAAGTRVYPVYETGTWTEKNGRADVHFDMSSLISDGHPTNTRRTSIDLGFSLSRCALTLVSDPAKLYGSRGLTFTKQECP